MSRNQTHPAWGRRQVPSTWLVARPKGDWLMKIEQGTHLVETWFVKETKIGSSFLTT
jgi:hypothetical protein